MGDWLGTGTIATFLRDYLSYEEAREFVHKLNLKSQTDWKRYSRSGKMPENIPMAPDRAYNKKGWKGYGDWLGTGTVATHLRTYLPFKEARNFVHKLKIESVREWRLYAKSNERPNNIPYWPDKTYKNRGWSNWGDWLGTGNIAPQLRNYLPYEKARKFVHRLKLKSNAEWIQYINGGEKPDNIPAAPQGHYKGKGWKNWGDWLGTGRIAHQLKKFRAFEDAKAFVHALKLKSKKEWDKYCQSGKKPDDIPADSYTVYKNKGWKSWNDWLGKD